MTVHKWAGLVAGFWLLVLGATGIVLDHDEWRWARQTTVPENWLSPRVARLLPATRMRHIAAEVSESGDIIRWLGASERGAWWSEDAGQSWVPVPFDGETGAPQVLSFFRPTASRLDGTVLATDDGLWIARDGGRRAERLALDGEFVHSLTSGSQPGEMLGIVDHDRVFRLDFSQPADVDWREFDDVQVAGLPVSISLYEFVFDLHFGYALGSRTVATFINDLGGLALIVLALTGFFYWWFPYRWRSLRTRLSPRRKRGLLAWLYRSHAPIIGVLGAIPIAYLALTAIPLSHVQGFGEWGRDVGIDRSLLPGVYQYRSLHEELDDVVGFPGEPDRLAVSTRYGVLETRDGGRTWDRDIRLPETGGNLFRAGRVVFYSNNSGDHYALRDGDVEWRALPGIRTILTDALRIGDTWYLKNSRGFNVGTFDTGFETAEIGYKPSPGATLYLFLIDIHVGLIIHSEFKWVNDLASILAVLLAITGPILWWRQRWR